MFVQPHRAHSHGNNKKQIATSAPIHLAFEPQLCDYIGYPDAMPHAPLTLFLYLTLQPFKKHFALRSVILYRYVRSINCKEVTQA